MKRMLFVSIDPVYNRRRVLNQMALAAKMGFEVHLITIAGGAPGQTNAVCSEIAVPAKSGPLKFLFFNLHLFLQTVFHRYQVIHARGLWVLPALLIRALFRHSAVIYDAHEYFAGLDTFARRRLVRGFWLWCERMSIPHMHSLVTVSEPIADLYRKRYPALQRIDVLRNVPDYQQPKARFKSPYDGPLVLFHGYFMAGRGLELLVRAMSALPQVHLLLVGDGILKNKLQQLVGALNLEQRIHFQDFVPYADLIDFASQADIACTLLEPLSENHRNALPNKFFEYLMAGLPVLASDIATMHDYVPRLDVGRICKVDSAQSIAEALDDMLSDGERLARWRENALQAAKVLCWEKEQSVLKKIYDELYGKRDQSFNGVQV